MFFQNNIEYISKTKLIIDELEKNIEKNINDGNGDIWTAQ